MTTGKKRKLSRPEKGQKLDDPTEEWRRRLEEGEVPAEDREVSNSDRDELETAFSHWLQCGHVTASVALLEQDARCHGVTTAGYYPVTLVRFVVEHILSIEDVQMCKVTLSAIASWLRHADVKLAVLNTLNKLSALPSTESGQFTLVLLLRALRLDAKKITFSSPYWPEKAKCRSPRSPPIALTKVLVRLSLQKVQPRPLRLLLSSKLPSIISNPLAIADFLASTLRRCDETSVLALEPLVNVILHHNYEMADFYSCVYSLLRRELVESQMGESLLHQLDMVLSSPKLTQPAVAAFLRRLAMVSLATESHVTLQCLTLLHNLIIRHSLGRLVHAPDCSATSDPYRPDESAPELAGAYDSSLVELRCLARHWHGDVAALANRILHSQSETELPWPEESPLPSLPSTADRVEINRPPVLKLGVTS